MFQRFDFAGQALGERHAAAANADEPQAVEIGILLQDFVRQPHQGAVDFRGAHELAFDAGEGHGRGKQQRSMADRAAEPNRKAGGKRAEMDRRMALKLHECKQSCGEKTDLARVGVHWP